MKETIKYTILITIGIAAGFYIRSAFNSPKNIENLEKKLDSLTIIVNSNNIKIEKNNNKIFQFERKTYQLDSQDVVLENKIIKYNKNVENKIKVVDNFSNDSLFKSITNRYNK